MDDQRVFPNEEVHRKLEDYHGGCRFVRAQPDITQHGIGGINIEITFEQAMRLHLALQSAMISLNRYNRATSAGREMGVLLWVNAEGNSISVVEKHVEPERE